MEYKKIENLIYKSNLISRNNYSTKKEYDLKLDSMLIENLQKCIDKNVQIDMDEKDVVKIYKVYIKLLKNNYDIDKNFIHNLLNISSKKIDFFELIDDITI